MTWRGSFEELEKYLRDYANLGGEVVPYHTAGVLGLLLAVADNLRANALTVDLKEIVPKAMNAEQAPCRPVMTSRRLARQSSSHRTALE